MTDKTAGCSPSATADGIITPATDYLYCGRFTASASGTLASMSIYCVATSASTPRLRFGLYEGGTSDTDPAGATLVWETGLFAPENTDDATYTWKTIAFGTGSGTGALVSGQRYWICGGRTQNVRIRNTANVTGADDATVARVEYNTSAPWNFATAMPTTLDGTSGNNASTRGLMAYLTYTVSGSSVAPLASAYYRMLNS